MLDQGIHQIGWFNVENNIAAAGRAGVPLEVMGLMLGEFVDEYTVKVVDVFAMPQSGTGVSVEAVDPVFQMKMLEMLKQVRTPLTSEAFFKLKLNVFLDTLIL